MNNRQEIWRQISPWLLSALLASLLPLALLVFSMTFPDIWTLIVGENDYFPNRFFILGIHFPLSMTSRMFLVLTITCYWGLGFLFLTRQISSMREKTHIISHIPLNMAIGGLFFMIPLMVTLYSLAYKCNALPLLRNWWVCEGNHGPWRQIYDLRKLLSFTLWIPLFAGPLALLSAMIKFNKLSWIVLFCCIIAFFILIGTHYWLID